METEASCKYLFKIILIGDSGVGKTCLMYRYTDDSYQIDQASTIGVDFKIRTAEIDNKKVKLQIWDTAGQERFRSIISNYYRGAHGILVVFDMCSNRSLENLETWIDEVRKYSAENVEIIVIGNKVDDKDNIVVTKDEVEKILTRKSIGMKNFYMTSAKDNICVEDAFVGLTKRLVDEYSKVGFVGLGGDNMLKLKPDIGQSNSCC